MGSVSITAPAYNRRFSLRKRQSTNQALFPADPLFFSIHQAVQAALLPHEHQLPVLDHLVILCRPPGTPDGPRKYGYLPSNGLTS